MSMQETIVSMAVECRKAAREIAGLSTEVKNRVLLKMADALLAQRDFISRENELDLAAGRDKGLSSAMLDRDRKSVV